MSQPRSVSRRTFLSTGATLLAGFGAVIALPAERGSASPAPAAPPPPTGSTDLALYRPVSVSSTDYAPTPAAFAVDGLSHPGVKGSGWRAAQGDPQWISVDLQASCRVEAVTLVFEATSQDPAFNGDYTHTTGDEILSSAAVDFHLDVSTDGRSWTTVYQTTGAAGGELVIAPAAPATARWVRLTATKRSSTNPVGLNGFQVYGTCDTDRPAAQGWTTWANHQPAPALSLAADGTVPVESGWVLSMDDFVGTAGGAALSGPAVDTTAWLPATVPGTVLASLVEQGHLPDPVEGFNNLRIPEALSRHAWWYRRAFRLPAGFDTAADGRIWLEFDGINHHAEAWVNGTNVGTLTHPFARAALDITEALGARDNEHALAVQITPMPHPGTPGDKSANGNTFVQSAELYQDSPTYLAVSGWDWMPAVRDRVAGIWDHVRLRSTGPVVIGDAQVVTTLPDLPDRSTAEVRIVVPVRNVSSAVAPVTVQAAFGDVVVSETVTLAAGASGTVTFAPEGYPQLRLRDPQLWWPNGYGYPHLYALTLTATHGATVSDRRVLNFGIREFGYAWQQPVVVSPPGKPPLTFTGDAAPQTVTFTRQQARYLRIQCGQRATGWGVSLWSLAVIDSAAPDTDLARGAVATASSTDNDADGAGNAVDGDPGTRWSSAYQDDQWIQVDLGAPASFDRVDLVWEQAYALNYTVRVSADGASWTDVREVSNDTPIGDTAVQTEDFAEQTARYLRVQCGARVTSWGVSMWTLSVFDSASPNVDLASHRTATASSVDSDANGPGNAVDGNPRTRWSSAYQDGQWIQVDLGAATRFDRVVIAWEQAYARDYVIQVSTDGVNWTDVKSVSNAVTQLAISVNGVPVFCRGGNWGWDELLRRVLPDRMSDTVAMHRDMNFTMIRNWIGSSNRDEFYRACDENGILVWNDFWDDGYFPDDQPGYLDLAADTIRRYRNHPCIVVWCGANEAPPPPDLDAGLAQAVATAHPGVLYQSNSAGGIVSGHGPYRWIDPAQYYDRNTYDTGAFGFHTEIGIPVVSVVDSMRNLIGDQPEWPIGEVWNYHDWSTIGNQQVGGYQAAIEQRLGQSGSLEEFCRKAQFVNYESTRAMFEAWNANLWHDATGLLLWMSHPAWHSTVWQTYDYDLDVNGAYFGSRAGCEPLHVQADPTDWQIRAVNHTASDLIGATVTARLYDLSGRQLGADQRDVVDVKASSTTAVSPVASPPSPPALHLLRLQLHDRGGALRSENTYWRYRTAQDMQLLNTLPGTRLALSVGDARTGGGRNTLTATVGNRGATVAAMVRLSLRDPSGARILPASYEQNYFWLLPGEVREVDLSWPSRLSQPAGARVTAEAYNAGLQQAG
jgi:hypothetical protein